MVVTDEMNNRQFEIVRTIINKAIESKDNIRDVMSEGITKSEIADAMDVTTRTVGNWMAEKIPDDRVEQLQKMAIFFGITLAAVQETRLYAPWPDGTTTANDHATLTEAELNTILELHRSNEWKEWAQNTRQRMLDLADAILTRVQLRVA